mgnify:CR=1 FL=1
MPLKISTSCFSMKIDGQVLNIAWDLKKCLFPTKPTTANVSAYGSLSVNMIVMDCAERFSPELSREQTQKQLTSFVKDLGIGMNTDIRAKDSLGKEEMNVSVDDTSLISLWCMINCYLVYSVVWQYTKTMPMPEEYNVIWTFVLFLYFCI